MEFLNVFHGVVLMICMFLADGFTQTDKNQSGITGKEQELKEMLNTVREQNRKLVLQNKRLQQVWFGMQQMCKALSMPTCDCNQIDNIGSSVNSSSTPYAHEKQTSSMGFNKTLPLKVLAIKSSGSISNVTNISITYVASPDHFVSWIGPRDDGRTWRKGGRKTQTVPGSEIYTSLVDVEDLRSIRTIFFRLHDDEHSISIRLNTTAAEIAQEQNVTAPYSSLINVNTTYTAPQNSDLTITAVVKLNITVIGEFSFVELLLTGLNTSANPPTYFETFSVEPGVVSLNFSEKTNESTNVNITLSNHFIKYGGILNIRLPYIESSNDRMVEKYSFGPSIKIYGYGTNEVIPQNTVGTMPLQNQTFIFSPSTSIVCIAVGNPRPNATILKVDDNGGFIKPETENIYIDRYSHLEVLSLSANQRTNEARYICRASNGDRVVETATEAIIVKEVVIDDSRTGVVKNTSNTIVISCKAKGKPRPEVDFRLYDEYGPFMIKSGIFKFWKSTSGKYTSRVTLTLSPVDDVDVHTVYCHAAQGDIYRSIERYRKINVFPEGRDNNWDLYHRVQAAQVF